MILEKRKAVSERYKKELKGLVQFQVQNPDSTQNYGFPPIVLKDEEQTLKLQKALNEHQIFPRRYFYPELQENDQVEIIEILKSSL